MRTNLLTCQSTTCTGRGRTLWPSYTRCPRCGGTLVTAEQDLMVERGLLANAGLTARSPLDAKVAVIVEHAATLAAPAVQLDELDRLQLLQVIRTAAASALPLAVRAALDAGASGAMVERILGRSERTAAVTA